MKTTIIGIRDFRKNITKLTQDKNTTYIVTVHNKPALEVKPCQNEEIGVDESQIQYYKTIEKNLNFWDNEVDNDIFAE